MLDALSDVSVWPYLAAAAIVAFDALLPLVPGETAVVAAAVLAGQGDLSIAAVLAAADALEKRAHAIHDWPIDEGTFARVLTITTSVIGITIARLILDPFGL
jgi:hypothetical protein